MVGTAINETLKHLISIMAEAESYDEVYTTRQTIILPILRACGWQDHKRNEVWPEYSLAQGKVDYALFAEPGTKNPSILIEVKNPSKHLDSHQSQIGNYAFQKSIPFVVLTNGYDWWFYLPHKRDKPWEKRIFLTMKIEEGSDLNDLENLFRTYLWKENILNGEALRNAEAALDYEWDKEKYAEVMPEVWRKMLEEPDGLLVELLQENVKEGYDLVLPKDDALNFLREFSKKAVQTANFFSDESEHPEDRTKKTGQSKGAGGRTHKPWKHTYQSSSLPPDGTACRFSYKGTEFRGMIRDGKFHVDGFGSFGSVSGASYKITQGSRNGWRDWEIKLPGEDSWQLANDWRKKQK